MRHRPVPVVLGGELGSAQKVSSRERLAEFVVDKDSEALALFLPAHRDSCATGDWYGEHVGKWLVTVTRSALRDSESGWEDRISRVLEVLSEAQEPSGYLGTYAPEAPCRFTHPQVSGQRTWDLWVHSWLLLGLCACAQIPGLRERALSLAVPVGDLIYRTFASSPVSAIRQGNHQGLSSLVVLEPLVRLAAETNDSKYSLLASDILQAAHEGGLPLLARPAVPIHTIGTGKIYQVLWVMQGMLALGQALGQAEIVDCVKALWSQVKASHLTPFGGPWGGIATHKEVFNPAGYFHPSGLVETCSSTTWLTLSQELFLLTGDPAYGAEVERTSQNALLGALDANGRDWCYFTFPNGRRNNTYHWACCKSSGALGLEMADRTVLTDCAGTLWLNQWVDFDAGLPDGGSLSVRVEPQRLVLRSTVPVTLRVRLPQWAVVPGEEHGDHLMVEIDQGEAEIPYSAPPRIVPFTYLLDHHGQEIVREDYIHVQKGPHVYAAGKVDGYAAHPTLRLPQLNPHVSLASAPEEDVVWLHQAGLKPLRLEPFHRAGGRHDSAWRMLWLEVAWQ